MWCFMPNVYQFGVLFNQLLYGSWMKVSLEFNHSEKQWAGGGDTHKTPAELLGCVQFEVTVVRS